MICLWRNWTERSIVTFLWLRTFVLPVRMWAEWRYRHQARRKYRHQAHHTAADTNFLTQMQDELNRLQTRHVEQQWKLALLFSSLQTGCFFSSCGGFTDACYLSCRRPLWRQTAHQGEWHDEWQVENITKWSRKRAGTASSSLFSERNCAYCLTTSLK